MNGFSLRKLLFKGGEGRPPKDIAPGMRYKQLSQLGSVWVVKRLVKPVGLGLPHVMIQREGSDDVRVISTYALKDRDAYRYIPPEMPAPSPKDFT